MATIESTASDLRNNPVTDDATNSAPGDGRWTVRRVLEWTTSHLQRHGSESPRLDAEILLAHARNCRRVELYTQYNVELSDGERAAMRDLVQRRAQREPVAYLVGYREFFSLDFRVTPDVLIPRPDTETLVVELIEAARSFSRPGILDVGTGSGCIAIAAAVNLPAARITAIDVSEAALQVARENARAHEVSERISFLQGDLFGPVGGEKRFEFIVSNPPYVAEGELDRLPEDIRRHEPHQALTAGPDGLDVIRRLVGESPRHLAPGGRLMFEIAPEQADSVRNLLESSGQFARIRTAADLTRTERVVVAQLVE